MNAFGKLRGKVKNLELLSRLSPGATVTLFSCSSNFPREFITAMEHAKPFPKEKSIKSMLECLTIIDKVIPQTVAYEIHDFRTIQRTEKRYSCFLFMEFKMFVQIVPSFKLWRNNNLFFFKLPRFFFKLFLKVCSFFFQSIILHCIFPQTTLTFFALLSFSIFNLKLDCFLK